MSSWEPLNVKNVLNALAEVSEWHSLGIQLDIVPNKLRELEEYPPHERKVRMIERWLENDPNQTWEKLLKGLKDIGHNQVAEQVMLQYRKAPESTKKALVETAITTPSGVKVSQQEASPGDEQNEAIREEVAEISRQNEGAIRAKYAALLTRVCNKLRQKRINIREFCLFTVSLFSPGDCIPHSTDVQDIFEAITRNQLWDYWNYRSLEAIVQQFGADDAEMLSWVSEYKNDLAGFKACTKIVDYISVVESDTSFDESDSDEPIIATPAKYDRRYRRRLSLKLKVNIAEHSLLYIDRLWSSIAEVFLLPPLSALLDCIRKGCITVTWLIPTGLTPHLLQQVQGASSFFRENRIQSIYLEKRCIFSEEIAVQQRSSEKDPERLFQACKDGDLEAVLEMVATGIGVDIEDTGGETPLIWASCHGHLGIVNVLLGNGANVNAQNKDGWTPLIGASRYGYLSIVTLLLAHHANVNVQTKDGWTPLIGASFYGYLSIVTLLLAHHANVNAQTKDGWTPLIGASFNGFVSIVTLLLAHHANVNVQAKDGWSALMYASEHNHHEVVRMLTDGGAIVNVQSKNGVSALWVASQNGHQQIVHLLIEQGANVNTQDENGVSALWVASQEGHQDIVRLLIEQGANVNTQREDGVSALLMASQKGHLEVVRLLIEQGANVNLPNKDGVSALFIASQKGHQDIVRLLIEQGANVNTQREDGVSALLVASQNGHLDVVRILTKQGANVNLLNKDGVSALFIASQEGHQDIVRLLIEQGANVNTQREDQVTALMIASYSGSVEAVKELLSSGAAVDMQDKVGRCALIFASQQGHSGIVTLLADNGAQLNMKNDEGRTALALASWEGHINVVRVLVARGIDPNIQDDEGLTALIIAIKQGHTEVVHVLVNDAKADVNIQEKSTGWSALFFTAKDGNLVLTRLLIQAGANLSLKDKNEVTALDVAKVVHQEEVCEELRRRMGSGRHGQQQPRKEVNNQVASAVKFLQGLFREVEKRILRTRTLKMEMTGKELSSSSQGPFEGSRVISTQSVEHKKAHKKAWYKT